MLLFLTGANNSLSKSFDDNPQMDANKSLGGYISSTAAPNAGINSLFDTISSYTLEKRQKETIALGLVNTLNVGVKNVELKIVSDVDNISTFKIAAVKVGSDYRMESIANRYQEPMSADFHDASFYRAYVDVEIVQSASKGEEIALYPFNVSITVQESGLEGTWKAIEEAFSNNEVYKVKRLSENKLRISRCDEELIITPPNCFFVATDNFSIKFLNNLVNKADNTVLIADSLEPKAAIGLWIQREINKSSAVRDNEQLLNDFNQHKIDNDVEEVEIIINFDLID